MEQEQNIQIARDIAEATGACVEHRHTAAVARVRLVSGSHRLENVCADCFDRFVIARYPRSGRATQARARLAEAQGQQERTLGEGAGGWGDFTDTCDYCGVGLFPKDAHRCHPGTDCKGVYCAEHIKKYVNTSAEAR
jgi:hypothetical protein